MLWKCFMSASPALLNCERIVIPPVACSERFDAVLLNNRLKIFRTGGTTAGSRDPDAPIHESKLHDTWSLTMYASR